MTLDGKMFYFTGGASIKQVLEVLLKYIKIRVRLNEEGRQ
jgi:hypothetical protein